MIVKEAQPLPALIKNLQAIVRKEKEAAEETSRERQRIAAQKRANKELKNRAKTEEAERKLLEELVSKYGPIKT